MKYYFVLGNNPALSIAELNSLIDLSNSRLITQNFLIVDLKLEFNASELIKRLGGIIKIGVIRDEYINNFQTLLDKSLETVLKKKDLCLEGKFNFGISNYNFPDLNKKDLGLKIKKELKDKNINSRFVVSSEKTLSSVVITQNKLIKKGIELVVCKDDNGIIIGETLDVQPFKDLSKRDFGRPARDDHSGMLPPKLAMAMINIASQGVNNLSILDPFCGSGTVLGESALMGFKNIYGSDLSKKAIDDTFENFNWIKNRYNINDLILKLKVKSAEKLSQFIKTESIDIVVTEPYLGPQRGMINFKETIDNLETLYSKAISEFYKILKDDGRVVMVWPSFYGQKPITPNYQGFKIISPLPNNLKNNKLLKITDRNTILYGRQGQKVYREIVILEKTKTS